MRCAVHISKGAPVPVPQFNPFENLDNPVMGVRDGSIGFALWHRLSNERKAYLEGVEGDLIGKPAENNG